MVLAPPVLLVLLGYSLAKRFTWAAHAWLGLALALAPGGAWLATGAAPNIGIVLLMIAVITWLFGFDVLYALQDEAFDRAEGLRSVPAARFGARGARDADGRVRAHVVTVSCLVGVALRLHRGPVFLGGVALVAAILMVEHRLVRGKDGKADLTKIPKAFFDCNAYVSMGFFAATLIDAFVHQGVGLELAAAVAQHADAALHVVGRRGGEAGAAGRDDVVAKPCRIGVELGAFVGAADRAAGLLGEGVAELVAERAGRRRACRSASRREGVFGEAIVDGRELGTLDLRPRRAARTVGSLRAARRGMIEVALACLLAMRVRRILDDEAVGHREAGLLVGLGAGLHDLRGVILAADGVVASLDRIARAAVGDLLRRRPLGLANGLRARRLGLHLFRGRLRMMRATRKNNPEPNID